MFKKTIKKQEKKEEIKSEIKSEIKEVKKSPLLTNKDKLEAAKKETLKARENLKFKFKLKNKKLYLFSAIGIVLLVTIIMLLSNYLDNLKYKPYIQYEDKMKVYGFDKLYDNQSAKTNETVTKAEALKLAIASVFNTSDISGFAAEHSEYENAIWVEYAKDMKVTTEDININNYNNKVKYIDAITYFENCKKIFLKNEKIDDLSTKFKDLSKYTAEEQTAIRDMVSNGIIAEISSKLNGNNNIFKGQLNEIVVKFVEQYNTITMSGEKLNINPEKIPSNAVQYPYTIASVDKSVYEKPFFAAHKSESFAPRDLYKIQKEDYTHIKARIEDFFNGILNIDYKTITVDDLKSRIAPYVIYQPDRRDLEYYVKYVKDNEIIIQGNSKLQEPIIYYDGVSYRARLNLKFEIVHSKSNINLIYLDIIDGYDKTYEKTTYDIFADFYITKAMGDSNNMYVKLEDLYETILDKENCGILRESDDAVDSTEEGYNENN